MTSIRLRRAFTMVELLVVLAVISVLFALIVPALATARERAVSAKCLSNLKGIGLAFGLYASDYDGRVLASPNVFVNQSGTWNQYAWVNAFNGTLFGTNSTTGVPNGTVYLRYQVGTQSKASWWNAGICICPKMIQSTKNGTDPGLYGMVKASRFSSTEDQAREGIQSYDLTPSPNYRSISIRFLNRIEKGDNLLIMSDSSCYSADINSNTYTVNYGCYNVEPGAIMTSSALLPSSPSPCGTIWMAHGNYPAEWANGLFADMHAESCDPTRLLACANRNGVTSGAFPGAKNRAYGVNCWKDSSNCGITYNNNVATGTPYFH